MSSIFNITDFINKSLIEQYDMGHFKFVINRMLKGKHSKDEINEFGEYLRHLDESDQNDDVIHVLCEKSSLKNVYSSHLPKIEEAVKRFAEIGVYFPLVRDVHFPRTYNYTDKEIDYSQIDWNGID